jgi:hypothetical protein
MARRTRQAGHEAGALVKKNRADRGYAHFSLARGRSGL